MLVSNHQCPSRLPLALALVPDVVDLVGDFDYGELDPHNPHVLCPSLFLVAVALAVDDIEYVELDPQNLHNLVGQWMAHAET